MKILNINLLNRIQTKILSMISIEPDLTSNFAGNIILAWDPPNMKSIEITKHYIELRTTEKFIRDTHLSPQIIQGIKHLFP